MSLPLAHAVVRPGHHTSRCPPSMPESHTLAPPTHCQPTTALHPHSRVPTPSLVPHALVIPSRPSLVVPLCHQAPATHTPTFMQPAGVRPPLCDPCSTSPLHWLCPCHPGPRSSAPVPPFWFSCILATCCPLVTCTSMLCPQPCVPGVPSPCSPQPFILACTLRPHSLSSMPAHATPLCVLDLTNTSWLPLQALRLSLLIHAPRPPFHASCMAPTCCHARCLHPSCLCHGLILCPTCSTLIRHIHASPTPSSFPTAPSFMLVFFKSLCRALVPATFCLHAPSNSHCRTLTISHLYPCPIIPWPAITSSMHLTHPLLLACHGPMQLQSPSGSIIQSVIMQFQQDFNMPILKSVWDL